MRTKAKTTKKKVVARKPRVATREQRVTAMFETTNEAYNKLMETHLKLAERYNQLLEQNTTLRIQLYRLELSGGAMTDDLLKDDDWSSMADALNTEPETYGKDLRPVNRQRNTNDLYQIAKQKDAEKHAQYQERLEQYAEQEESVERALAEARVSERPLDVQLSEAKQKYYIEAGKSIMGTK